LYYLHLSYKHTNTPATLTMGKPRPSSTGMFILNILISLAVLAQNGSTVHAIENSNAKVNVAVPSEGGPSKDAFLQSSLRGLLNDEIMIDYGDASATPTSAPSSEPSSAPSTSASTTTSSAPSSTASTTATMSPTGSLMPTMVIEIIDGNDANETAYPEGTAPTEPAEFGETSTEATESVGELSSGKDEGTAPTEPAEFGDTSAKATESAGEIIPGEDQKVEEVTASPTPEYDEGNDVVYPNPSYSPSPYPSSAATESYWDSKPYTRPTNPTRNPTLKPTVEYIPKGEDSILEEEEVADTVDFTDDDLFYHGLGGIVGEYLDGVESPQEMEKDTNVQIMAGTLVGVFMVLMLVTAHMVMNHPDGLCAGFCRLTLKVICCFTRTLCLPCRAICCKGGSDQAHNRRTHAPMGRTPFPTDLELA